MHILLIVALVLLGIWIVGSYLAIQGLEEPAYTVIEKKNGYEIRQYESYIIVEVDVEGKYDDALNDGFRIIADYIFGNNTKQTSIAMTAPVSEERKVSEKIAMTVPVIDETSDNETHLVSFVMPSKYTLETLPKPNNSRVKIREVPATKVAALSFTWYATDSRVAMKKQQLQEMLSNDGIEAVSLARIAQYNPPLSFPLMRRNEILIDITL